MTFCMIDFAYVMQSFLLASECRQCSCIWPYFPWCWYWDEVFEIRYFHNFAISGNFLILSMMVEHISVTRRTFCDCVLFWSTDILLSWDSTSLGH